MITASAPATLMLMGEHAVLHGKHALVATLSPRLSVSLTPRDDQKISIESALGQYESLLDDIEIKAPFAFVLSLVKQFQAEGFHLKIESNFSSTVGLGSSAAVLVATTMALSKFLGKTLSNEDLFKRAHASLIEVQGRGSGADLTAAIWGGMIQYRQTPFLVRPLTLPKVFPLTLIYSGYKTPTTTVIQHLEDARIHNPAKFERLFNAIDKCVISATTALSEGDLELFAAQIRLNQNFMVEMGLSDPTLEEIISALNGQPEIRAAKISGSGLGDCVFGIGQLMSNIPGWPILPVSFSDEGVRLHLSPT